VHPEILRSEGVADGEIDNKTALAEPVSLDRGSGETPHRNGTRIVKFYLHLSKKEQRQRFLQRIDEPQKNWKFSLSDVEERKFWRRYMLAYEECLSVTSTREAPWYVVPADDKENARLIVSQIILDTLNGLEMTYPEVSAERRQELQSIRERADKPRFGLSSAWPIVSANVESLRAEPASSPHGSGKRCWSK
jgi:hypothetical protein